MRLDELSLVVRRSRRILKDSSSRRTMRLVSGFILKMYNQTNCKCLPKFVPTAWCVFGIKTARTHYPSERIMRPPVQKRPLTVIDWLAVGYQKYAYSEVECWTAWTWMCNASNYKGESWKDNVKSTAAGTHHQERATTPYSCHGVSTDRSIFSLDLPRIQTPAGTSETNH